MSFLKILKNIVSIGEAVAPSVATVMNPAAGALVGLVVNAVTQAEQAGGSGAEKRLAVMQSLLQAATVIVNASLHAQGAKTQVDPVKLSSAIGSIVDGVVALMNSVQAPAVAGTTEAAGAAGGTTQT